MLRDEPTSRIREVLMHYGADVPDFDDDRWHSLRCPFHEDRHASSSFNYALDGFRCQACSAAGNAVTLLMKVERLSAREADARATEIAGHPGLSLTRRSSSPRRGGTYKSPRLRRRLA